MVIRVTRLAATLLRIAQNLRHADKGPSRLSDWKCVVRDLVDVAETLPSVLAPAVRPLRCLPLLGVMQVDSLGCPAMPLPPTMPRHHNGPTGNVHTLSHFV